MSPKEAQRFFDSMEIAKSLDMCVRANSGGIILSSLPSLACVEVFDDSDQLYFYLRGYRDAKKS